jgi:hypothetical protein
MAGRAGNCLQADSKKQPQAHSNDDNDDNILERYLLSCSG